MSRTTYLIPMFSVLMMIAIAPVVMADNEQHQKDYTKFKSTSVIEGFVGSIPIDNRMIDVIGNATVTLSEASNGLDVISGKLQQIENETGKSYLVWSLISKEHMGSTVTVTNYIIDAGDISNTVTNTEEVNPTEDKIDTKIDKLERKSHKSSGNSEIDNLRADFLVTFTELKDAIALGNSDLVAEKRAELQNIRGQINSLR